jgi:hypothetical protein
MREGRSVAEFSRRDANEEAILAAAIGQPENGRST